MQIHSLQLSNFRGFRLLELELHPRCVVLAGVNGSGKSSVLDGLAVALGTWFLGFNAIKTRPIHLAEIRRERRDVNGHVNLEPQFPVRVQASGDVAGHKIQWARELRSGSGKTTTKKSNKIRQLAETAQLSVQRGDTIDLPVLAYYGTGRLWVQKRESSQKELNLSSRTSGYQDCLDPESNHKLFEAWMKQHEQARLQRISRGLPPTDVEDLHLEAVAHTAARCIEGGTHFYYDLGGDELRLVFEDQREQSFALLSDGYRNLIALAADLAWRAVRLNPHQGRDAPAQAAGVVLIDEMELHLHPAWQRSVLKRLQEAFPRLQFIVTTHSPQIIASAPAECIRFLDHEHRVHHVKVAEGLDTNTVLRDLMGVPERPPHYIQWLERTSDLIDARRFDEARVQIDALAARFGLDDPVITALEWDLADARSLDVEAR